MIIIADTNILARIVTKDDESQFEAAQRTFLSSTKIVVPVVVFCELTWLLRSSYKCDGKFIATAIRGILANSKIVTEDDAVLAGLRILDDGGDFADGVVQYTGSLLAGGPSTFASFDQGAVSRLAARGVAAMIPQ
jgi:predicted nucleic-acid-binding protein